MKLKELIQTFTPTYDREYVGPNYRRDATPTGAADIKFTGGTISNNSARGLVENKIIALGTRFSLSQKFYSNQDNTIILRSNSVHGKLFRKICA